MANFYQIPPEILRNIFLHFIKLPNHDFRDIPAPGLYRSKDTFSTPLFLSHVCSKWRQVACSYPRLWSSIVLHRPSEQHLPLLHLWLLRSGNVPLALHVQSMVADQPMPKCQILRLLLPHSWRLKYFLVEIYDLQESLDFSCELYSHLASRTFKFPALERLIINFPPLPQKSAYLIMQLCNLLYEIPSLHTVFMPFPCLEYRDNLTAVIFDKPLTFDIILYTLACCPNINSMDVHLSSQTLHPYIVTGSVEHRSLSNFRITDAINEPQNSASEARRLLLNNLTATNLTVLDMNNDSDDICAIYNMILRSNCQLRSLSKLYLLGAAEHAHRLLGLPQLHHLEQLGLRGPSRTILGLLTLGSKGAITAVLPFLKFLDVEDILAPVGTALSDLLLSRFDSLEAATITTGDCIWNMPLANKLWSHPGYLIVARGKGKSVDVLKGREDGSNYSSHGEYVHHSWRPCVRY